MITYSGMFIVGNSYYNEAWDVDDVGSRFTFDEILALIDAHFEGQHLEKTILRGQYCNAIAFFQTSNHERGLRDVLFQLLEKLADLDVGVDAHCFLEDDEANEGKGGVWDLRLRDPAYEHDGFKIEQIDFTKRD